MSFIFWFSVVGEILIFPLYLWSLEHQKLQTRFGKAKGERIGDMLGLISGWGFFLFLFGIWLAPQPRFTLPMFPDTSIRLPIIELTIPVVHGLIFFPIIVVVLWFALMGVKEVTLKVAETHRPERVITKGVYTRVRHPQYLGALLAHLAISILLSALYSLLLTPLIVIYLYLIARKEETELIREFGSDYEEYRAKVPMLIPKIKIK
ncbi:MAG: methyltransferase family protein [Candidatus Hodarchaeales archaeon]|jgi:protein-S-isoprenylcysteine O-methyltransferase Ste14